MSGIFNFGLFVMALRTGISGQVLYIYIYIYTHNDIVGGPKSHIVQKYTFIAPGR